MRGYMLLERQRSVPLSLHGILSIMTQIALLMWWLATLLLLAGYMCVDGYHLRTSFLWFYRTAFLNKVNSSECYIFSLQGMIIAYWGSKTYRLCNCLYLFNMDATAIFPYVLIPFLPPSEWNMCWLLSCSNLQSISILWVTWFGKTAFQSWSHTIYPLYLALGNK